MPKWRPLSRRDDDTYDGPYEGVPDWLVPSLLRFVLTRLQNATDGVDQALHHIERRLRRPLDWKYGSQTALEYLRIAIVKDRQLFLDVLDIVVTNLTPADTADAVELMRQLSEAGSAWTIDMRHDGTYQLVRRVNQTVAIASTQVISSAGRAGQHLAKAWSETYGRHPDPSSAYREAVRAVEAAAAPIISPRNKTATLGTMIGDVRNDPSKWTVALQPTAGDRVDTVREMMRLLWTSELDRHGTSDASVPLHVSQEEAEAAVHLATTLVHWFTSGAISPRPEPA